MGHVLENIGRFAYMTLSYKLKYFPVDFNCRQSEALGNSLRPSTEKGRAKRIASDLIRSIIIIQPDIVEKT